MAKAWLHNILKESYQPPEDALFVAVQHEADQFDVVRCRYSAAGIDFETAQAFSMLCITVKNVIAETFESDQDRAERISKIIFETDESIKFNTIGQEDSISYGKQKASYDPFESDWAELLRWWCRGEDVGFLTIKTTKSLSKAVVGPGEEENTIWFDLYKIF